MFQMLLKSIISFFIQVDLNALISFEISCHVMAYLRCRLNLLVKLALAPFIYHPAHPHDRRVLARMLQKHPRLIDISVMISAFITQYIRVFLELLIILYSLFLFQIKRFDLCSHFLNTDLNLSLKCILRFIYLCKEHVQEELLVVELLQLQIYLLFK